MVYPLKSDIIEIGLIGLVRFKLQQTGRAKMKEVKSLMVSKVTIDENRCKGCGLCVRACPKKIMQLSKTKLNEKGYHPAEVIDQEACIACASCAWSCPDTVITVEKE